MNYRGHEIPDRFRAPRRVDGGRDWTPILFALLLGFCLGLVAGAAMHFFTQ